MKINIGRQTGKKYNHSLRRNYYSTMSVGFMQPTFSRELCSQDTISIRSASAVRLAPLSSPTFGRLLFKQYNTFVPFEEIWHPWGSFQAGKPYQGVGNSYVPLEVPSVPLSTLAALVALCGSWNVFKMTDSTYSTVDVKITTSSTLNTLLDHFLTSTSIVEGASFSSASSSAISSFASSYVSFNTFVDGLEDHLEASDMVIRYNDQGTSTHYLIFVRLSDRGRNLRKILLGCGYQLCSLPDKVSILPLVAYYKAYFDRFAVQRHITWKDTECFSFMEILEQYGVRLYDDVLKNGSVTYAACFTRFLNWFYHDLSTCFYTINPDFASAHITGLSVTQGTQDSFDYLGNGSITPQSETVGTNYSLSPFIPATTQITQQALDILKRLYNRLNINTAVGGRISEFMRAIFGSDYKQDEESNFVGSFDMIIDIDPVMNQAQTLQGDLGEYAGQGYQQSSGASLKFTARCAGIFVQMSTVVPESNLAQGVDPNLFHVEKMEYAQPDFDAVTLMPTRKASIYAAEDYMYGRNDLGAGFGNIPNYTEYKVAFDCVNGDMSLRSTRTRFLPYTLTKLLPFDVLHFDSGTQAFWDDRVQSSILVADDYWRQIGYYRWFGNFDRVFQNQGIGTDISYSINYAYDSVPARLDDNYILFIHHDFNISSYLLPLSDSFQTDPFSSAGHISVEKA